MKVKCNMPWFDGIQGMPSPNLKYLAQCIVSLVPIQTAVTKAVLRPELIIFYLGSPFAFPIVYPEAVCFLAKLCNLAWDSSYPNLFFPV